MTLTYRFFGVQPKPQKPGRKTVDYTVISWRGDLLGTLEFYPAWRQHVLVPAEGSVWSAGCLQEICDALEKIKGGGA
jgi:hypothetical protein